MYFLLYQYHKCTKRLIKYTKIFAINKKNYLEREDLSTFDLLIRTEFKSKYVKKKLKEHKTQFP